jgi:hypothetical protein
MNKKITMALVATLTLLSLTSTAKAEETKPTLAIIDTALDSTIPSFAGRITHEVCMLDWNSCPNKTSFMEGPGAAGLPSNIYALNNFDHGTQMTSIALAANPNMNVVFIRIIGNTPRGDRQITSEATVYKALNWVAQNKSKYNIQAVAMSQGRHDFPLRDDYCPKTPTTVASINTLIGMGVPTFFAAGNNRDYFRIDWPACLTESISIGATDQYNAIALYSNFDKNKIDFFALGITRAYKPGNIQVNAAGTSVSNQIAAAQWIALKQAKPTLTYQQAYDLLLAKSKSVYNSKITGGKLIDIGAAING